MEMLPKLPKVKREERADDDNRYQYNSTAALPSILPPLPVDNTKKEPPILPLPQLSTYSRENRDDDSRTSTYDEDLSPVLLLSEPPFDDTNVKRIGSSSNSTKENNSNRHMKTRDVINSLNQAATQSQRIDIVVNAIRNFQHRNEHIHDLELELGGGTSLCFMLGYLLLRTTQKGMVVASHTDSGRLKEEDDDISSSSSYNRETNKDWKEISLIVTALELMYTGCSKKVRQSSFPKGVLTDLVPLLLTVLQYYTTHCCLREELDYASDGEEVEEEDVVEVGTIKCIEIMRSFAKLDDQKVKLPLVQFRLQQQQQSSSSSNSSVCLLQLTVSMLQHAAVVPSRKSNVATELTGLLKDLTFRASDQVREIIFHHPDLIPTLLLQHGTTTTSAIATKRMEYLSAILWNLALTDALKPLLPRSNGVIDTLLSLASTTIPSDNQSSTASSSSTAHRTSINALSAIGNLLTATASDTNKENQIFLVQYKQGTVIQLLLQVMSVGISNDNSKQHPYSDDNTNSAKRRAIRIVKHLTTTSTAHLLLQQQQQQELYSSILLLPTLQQIISTTNHDALDLRIQSIDVIISLAHAIQLPTYQSYLSSLISTLLSILSMCSNVNITTSLSPATQDKHRSSCFDSILQALALFIKEGKLESSPSVPNSFCVHIQEYPGILSSITSHILPMLPQDYHEDNITQLSYTTLWNVAIVLHYLSSCDSHNTRLISNDSLILDILSYNLTCNNTTSTTIPQQEHNHTNMIPIITAETIFNLLSSSSSAEEDIPTTTQLVAYHDKVLVSLVHFTLHIANDLSLVEGRNNFDLNNDELVDMKEKAKQAIVQLVSEL